MSSILEAADHDLEAHMYSGTEENDSYKLRTRKAI